MFIGTLHTHYMEKMVGSNFLTFSKVVFVGEQIESQVKKGKLPCASSASSRGKKPYSNFPNNPEGQTNAIMGEWRNIAQPYILVPYRQVATITSAPYQ